MNNEIAGGKTKNIESVISQSENFKGIKEMKEQESKIQDDKRSLRELMLSGIPEICNIYKLSNF